MWWCTGQGSRLAASAARKNAAAEVGSIASHYGWEVREMAAAQAANGWDVVTVVG